MTVDSIRKNIAAYVLFLALSILVGGLQSLHVQYQRGGTIGLAETLDAIDVQVLPTLVMMLGSMKLASVGGERLAGKGKRVRDSLLVETPTERALEHVDDGPPVRTAHPPQAVRRRIVRPSPPSRVPQAARVPRTEEPHA
jgi:hypothetical protein